MAKYRRRRARTPEEQRDYERQRRYTLKKKYGITLEQYEAIYVAQGGKCAICAIATGATKALSVDHDHDTGEVRGLLCGRCNRTVMGTIDSVGVQRVIDYIENPPARGVLR